MTPSPQHVVAESRERFLTQESPAPESVRDTILASWRRSQDLHVAADKIEMSFEPDVQLDTRLSRSALPVLRTLGQQLQGQSVSVILTDASGLVLTRITGDRALESHLDQVLLAPGFSYAEKFVGTNGIGTALEMGGPAHVFGHEHYAEHLEDLACAGVPIHAPDHRPARRGGRLHLLAPRRRGTAAHVGQDHRRADSAIAPGGCGIERTRPVPGVSAYLRTWGRHRLRPEQRRGDVERLRAYGDRSSRPGGAPRPGQRDPDERTPQLGRGQSALGTDGPDVQPTGRYRRPAGRHRRPRQAGSARSPATGLDPTGAPAASRHRRHRSAVAQSLRGSRTGFPLGRVAGRGGRARSRETGGTHRRSVASATGRPPRGPGRPRRRR